MHELFYKTHLSPIPTMQSSKRHISLHFIIVGISLWTVPSQGLKQSDALRKLYREKFLSQGSLIDANMFDVSESQEWAEIKIASQVGKKEKDKIRRLPGQPKVGFSQYGGYVTINHTAGRAFYYYFAEAKNDKNSKPLLLWLNGGPGCSSLAFGAMDELGPFRVHSDGKTLFQNRFAWNQNANVLFVESPAGVGFSYSNTTSDFVKGGDRRTALDNYLFLLNWLKRFPEYKKRDFYISGESYAGHFVSQLAHTILHFNKRENKTIVNLKGIIIGNALINDETDRRGMYDYFATHALISPETSHRINKYCDLSQNTNYTKACDEAMTEIVVDGIDLYNIYAPLCHNSNLTDKLKKTDDEFVIDPCSYSYVYAYLNRPSVQKALNANVTKIAYAWQGCSDVIRKWEDSPSTIIPLLREIMENGLRVWIFSGDTDAIVPFTSTLYSIQKMKLPVKTAWHPWFINKYEVGGYTQVYKGDITFATVRGAGHQVPNSEPARALYLINHFLVGSPLPRGPGRTYDVLGHNHTF